MKNIVQKTKMTIKAQDLRLIVYDFDGVMTDNRVLVFSDGREAVFCNRADGLAVAGIKAMGIPQIVLSTEKNEVVAARARKLKLKVIQGVVNKRTALVRYCRQKKIELNRVVYIGNDVNDLETMRIVGFPLCPADANANVKRISRGVIAQKGGEGVIKYFYDRILKF